MSGIFGSSAAPAKSKDVEVVNSPPDSISSLSFSPAADFLAVGSWDNNVRIYAVGPQGQSEGKAMYGHQAPVLDVCWNKAGTQIISGGADNAARLYDVQTGQSRQVAAHDAAVKCVRSVETPQGTILATGSWDKTLKYWDLRSSQPVATVQLPERCYSIDAAYPLLVAATADRHLEVFNLTNPTKAFKSSLSPLKWQTRIVSCYPTADGFAVGSVEARAAMEYTEHWCHSKCYTFRCHRKEVTKAEYLVHSVNGVLFHPVQQSVFATCGSDGGVTFWDRDARTRLFSFDQQDGPISSIAFNSNGAIFAYAVSYDWHKGHGGMVSNMPNKVMLHAVTPEETRAKKK
ncbi:Poly(A)+ RNA export protein [Vararia minispora EC-137]|uniref:Poly(A)+ RNA export protein n=1 Tax=Vararia minispora EC-137 TaxID=1314806 RepID=A0ACB8QCD4_9AGAM|nr:Poly(A)+ RNA export protein [Vararia minispora EC-137]